MNKSPSSKASKTKLKRVRTMKDPDIDLSEEHPEADLEHIAKGVVRRGLDPAPAEKSISIRVDEDALEWYKAQGPGYQTRIHAVLRAFKDASL